MVAGHVLECGCQATGGNFSGFRAMVPTSSTGEPARPLGFPLAEVSADGSSVITKHDGTGGLVDVDTVTAQLLYEVQSTEYLGPDVTTHLDTIVLTDDGIDRVLVSGVRGSAPPERLKVGVNELGGHRNAAELVLTGLDIEDKAAWVRAQLEPRLTAASVTWTLGPLPPVDADTEEAASTLPPRCPRPPAAPARASTSPRPRSAAAPAGRAPTPPSPRRPARSARAPRCCGDRRARSPPP